MAISKNRRTPPRIDSRVHLYEARAAAAQGCPSAMAFLLWLMENEKASLETRRKAALDILAYGLGKPRETVILHEGEKVDDNISDAELVRRLAEKGFRFPMLIEGGKG